MELTITRVFRKQETSQKGKPYTRLAFKCQEFGEQWISGFGGNWNAHWDEGTVIAVGKDVELEDVTKGDKTYKNFKRIDKTELMEQRVADLEYKVKKLQDKVFGDSPVQQSEAAQSYDAQEDYNNMTEGDLSDEDIPF